MKLTMLGTGNALVTDCYNTCFLLENQKKIFDPYEKNHSTVKDACEIAKKLRVKNLLLYHTEDKNLKNREKLYKAEGEKYFHGNLFIPNDLDIIEL